MEIKDPTCASTATRQTAARDAGVLTLICKHAIREEGAHQIIIP